MNPAPTYPTIPQPTAPLGAASPTRTGAATTNQFTRQVIRQLLDGAAAATFAAIPISTYGQWADVVRLLFEAYAAGSAPPHAGTQPAAEPQTEPGTEPAAHPDPQAGTNAVATVYRSLVRMDDQLTQLMAGDEDAPRRSFKIKELLTANYPPLKFVIPDLIPVGLTILAGRPKDGKSWLALQIALAAYLGGTVLGRRVPRLKVLYLALEDTEYRLSDRLKKLAAGLPGGVKLDLEQYGDVDIFTDWSFLSERGLADLRAAIAEHGYDLIIIDTFSRILGRGDQMDQQEMTRIMAALQRLAAEHQAAILLIDHHRKSARTSLDADPIDDILGSTGKAGVVDCAMGLYRRHNQDEARLKLSGRDFGDSELALTWDPNAFSWNLKQGPGAAQAPRTHFTLREQETIDAVAELTAPAATAGSAGAPVGAPTDMVGATLAQLVAHTGHNKGSLYTRLQNLTARGALQQHQTARGLVYTLAPQSAPSPSIPGTSCGSLPSSAPGTLPVDPVEPPQPIVQSAGPPAAPPVVDPVESVDPVELVEVVDPVESVDPVAAVDPVARPAARTSTRPTPSQPDRPFAAAAPGTFHP